MTGASSHEESASWVFTRVFHNLLTRWSDTRTFREFVTLGWLPAATKIVEKNLELATQFLTDPENDKIFLNKDAFVAERGGAKGLGGALAAAQLESYRRSVDYASIVFMHSALDGAAQDLCRVSTMIAPGDWEQFVRDQKISIAELKAISYDALLIERIGRALRALERESLLRKIDRLFQICQPASMTDASRPYVFDRERLETLDDHRHAVIHGEAGELSDVEGALDYLLQTGLFLISIVNTKYGVQIDPDVVKHLP